MREKLSGEYLKYTDNPFNDTFNMRKKTIEAFEYICKKTATSGRASLNIIAATSGSGKPHQPYPKLSRYSFVSI